MSRRRIKWDAAPRNGAVPGRALDKVLRGGKPRFYRTAEVAEMLGLSKSTVHRLARKGLVRPWRTPLGGHRRFSKEDVRYLARLMDGGLDSMGDT